MKLAMILMGLVLLMSCAPAPSATQPPVTITITTPPVTVTATPAPPPPVTVTVTPTPTPSAQVTGPIYLSWILYIVSADIPIKMNALLVKYGITTSKYATSGNQTFEVLLVESTVYTMTIPADDLIQAAHLAANISGDPQAMLPQVNGVIKHLDNQATTVLSWQNRVPDMVNRFRDAYNLDQQKAGAPLISIKARDDAIEQTKAHLGQYYSEIEGLADTLRLVANRLQGKGD